MLSLLFSGLVALILLGFYVYAILTAILAAICLSGPNCQGYTSDLGEGVATVLSLVGGLVSALVVAELAVTTPGQQLAGRLLAASATTTTKRVLTVITTIYVLVWVISGVLSLIVGYMQHPNVVPALTSAAKSWLGLAVAAAYSYFGIKPSGGTG